MTHNGCKKCTFEMPTQDESEAQILTMGHTVIAVDLRGAGNIKVQFTKYILEIYATWILPKNPWFKNANIGSSKTWAIFGHPQTSTEMCGPKDPNFGQLRSFSRLSRPRTHLGSEHIPRYPLACRGVAVFLTCTARPQLGCQSFKPSNPICNFEEKTVSCF